MGIGSLKYYLNNVNFNKFLKYIKEYFNLFQINKNVEKN